jgi:hypothetical protein
MRAHANCLQNLAGLRITQSKASGAHAPVGPDPNGLAKSQQKLEEACRLVQEAISLQKDALKASPEHVQGQKYLAGHYRQLASIQKALGRAGDAANSERELRELSTAGVPGSEQAGPRK